MSNQTINPQKMLRQTLLLFLFGCLLNVQLPAQYLYKYYFDQNLNWPAGNPNMVYDGTSKSYFFVELDRDLNYSWTSALHVKHVGLDGTLLDTKYYITDFYPYSGHYISSVQIQGDEIVVFLNRNMNFPIVHDVFVFRIPKSLVGPTQSQRIYRQDDGELFLNSIKINETALYGDKIIFTGSVFTRGDLNFPAEESKLLIGVVHENGSIDYAIYHNGLQRIEGLSIMANYKELAFYISCRFSPTNSKEQLPLVLKAKFVSNNQVGILWSRVYPALTVDRSDYSSYNKGLELPLIPNFSKYNQPLLLARDSKKKNLVVTMFSKANGQPYLGKSQFFPLPEDKKLELLDAVKYTKKDGLVVLFTQEEQYNDVNTNSYVLHTSDVFDYSLNPRLFSLNSNPNVNSALGRRIMQVSTSQIGIGLFSNPSDPNLAYPDYHRASLLQANSLPFRCIEYDGLKKPFETSVYTYYSPLFPTDVIISEEARILYPPIDLQESTTLYCPTEEYITSPAATSRVANAEMKVFPNPASKKLNLTINGYDPQSFYALFLYDQTGKLVLSYDIAEANTTLKVDDLSRGVYHLQVQSASGIELAESIILQ